MMKEVQRVLVPNGLYIGISYGHPAVRSYHFKREHLHFTVKEIKISTKLDETTEDDQEKGHYIYV